MPEDYYESLKAKTENLIIYDHCNIYGNPKIGKNVKIGAFCDIGPCVIGDNVTIAAMCFIPAGVTIEDNVWLGPKLMVANDKNPPSPKSAWEKVLIKKGAVVGGGVIILPGVTIGEHARIGAGAVVTRNVPAYETWVGVPARKMEKHD